MSRLVSELGADVIDDSPQKKRKINPRKRNYTIGLTLTALGAIGLGLVYYFAANNWLVDYENMAYINYSLNEDEHGVVTASIKSVDNNSNYPSVFRVPEKIKGHKITAIDESAFQGCTRLKKVIMKDNIESIGEKAFINCEKLKSFTFSKNINFIGNDAFEGTAYKASWENNEYTFVNEILLDINENIILEKHGTQNSSIILVANSLSTYIDEYPDAIAFSLASLKAVEKGEAEVEHHVSQWMEGIFKEWKSIKAVETPSYLSKIPAKSFQNCENLEKVALGESNLEVGDYAFSNCPKLENISFHSNCSAIGKYAFENDAKLADVTLHTGLKTLGEGIFKGCTSMTNIIIPSTISAIPNNAFENTSLDTINYFNGGSNVNSIGSYAFKNTKFETFTFPKNVQSINDYVLADCPNLEVVKFYDDGPTRINGHAFANDTKLHSGLLLDNNGQRLASCTDDNTLYFPSTISLTSEGNVSSNKGYNFSKTAFKHVVINDNLKYLGTYIFDKCEQLENVTFNSLDYSLLREVSDGAFSGCSKLEEFVFPDVTRLIGSRVFLNCTSLIRVVLPDATNWTAYQRDYSTNGGTSAPVYFTAIKENIFNGCTSLEEVNIPRTVTKISEGSFQDCSSLRFLFVPSSVTNIAKNAFKGCDNLYVAIESIVKPSGFNSAWSNGLGDRYFFGSLGMNENEDYVYSFNTDNRTVTIIDIKKEVEETLVLPDEIEGHPVTGINDNFLNGNSVIKHVTLPKDLTNLGSGAFEDCENLEYSVTKDGFNYLATSTNECAAIISSVSYNDSEEQRFFVDERVQYINPNALSNSQITFVSEQSGSYIGSEGNPHFAFVKVSNESTITIEDDTVMMVSGSVVDGKNVKVTSLIIPSNVERIAKGACSRAGRLSVYCESATKPDGWDFSWDTGGDNTYWASLGPIDLTGSYTACLNLDGTARLTKFNSSSVVEISIPNEITAKDGNKYTVTHIASNFITNNSNLCAIYIPSSIEIIDELAIYECPSAIIYAEANACPANWDINFKDAETPIYFGVTKAINHVNIDGVDYIVKNNEAVVSGHSDTLASAFIPKTVSINDTTYPVTTIGSKAFYNASGLLSVYVPNTITSFEDFAFFGTDSAIFFFEGEIPEEFEEFERPMYENVASTDLVRLDDLIFMLSGDVATIVGRYDNIGGVTTIPGTLTSNGKDYEVTTIGRNAFENSGVTRLTFAEQITTIEEYAFAGSSKLFFTIIGDTLKVVGPYAFAGAPSNFNIFVYSDSVPSGFDENWNGKTIGSALKHSCYYGFDVEWTYNDSGVPVVIESDEPAEE